MTQITTQSEVTPSEPQPRACSARSVAASQPGGLAGLAVAGEASSRAPRMGERSPRSDSPSARHLPEGIVCSMTHANLGEMLKALDGELVNALEKSRASFQHKGSQGAAAEAAVRSLLDHKLPRYLSVGTGEVIDQADSRSGQLDIIIVNEDQPFRSSLNEPGVFLIEGISASGEVKSRLTTKALDEAIDTATRFKRLRSNDVAVIANSVGSDSERFRQRRPFFLFAFESAVAIPTLLSKLQAAPPVQTPDGTGGRLSPLDAVFILGKGVAIDYNDGNGAMRFTEDDRESEPVTGWYWHSTDDSVMIYFLLWLNSVMPRFVRLAPITYQYLALLANAQLSKLPIGLASRYDDLRR